jgi:hypothetical protein
MAIQQLKLSSRETLGLYRDCPEAKSASQRFSGGAVSIEPFQVGRSRLQRMRFAMGIQSYFLLLDRFTTAWERYRWEQQQVTMAPLYSSNEGSKHKNMPDCRHV